MDYEKFYQAVVLAYIGLDGNSEEFGNKVIDILNEFRANEQAAEQSVHPTAAGGSDSGENSESGGG